MTISSVRITSERSTGFLIKELDCDEMRLALLKLRGYQADKALDDSNRLYAGQTVKLSGWTFEPIEEN